MVVDGMYIRLLVHTLDKNGVAVDGFQYGGIDGAIDAVVVLKPLDGEGDVKKDEDRGEADSCSSASLWWSTMQWYGCGWSCESTWRW